MEEEIELYNEVNAGCSSRMTEIKNEVISDDEKVGQKRPNKEESVGIVSSSENESEEDINKGEAIVEEGTAGKGGQKKKNKKKGKKKR